MTAPTLGTYWRTVRHLRGSQLVALAQRRLLRRETLRWWKSVPVGLRRVLPPAAFPEWQSPSALQAIETREFRFLNVTRPTSGYIPWSSREFSRLWLYHLNYCDFLNVDLRAFERRFHLRRALDVALDWCTQNTTGMEVGWEPYPLSLRIVNWLKFLMRNAERAEALGEGKTLQALLANLRIQALALEARLETHLLGNHLMKNIKALMFAGALLGAPESSRWWAKGQTLLKRELTEQVLADGGHFERSPMYHAEVLEDLLDIRTLASACGRVVKCAPQLSPCIAQMAAFLGRILHADGEIPLLNDSALAIARRPQELLMLAGNSIQIPTIASSEVSILKETGYAVIRNPRSGSCLILDCGPLGPDYQPGHGHCDVLSYELSLHGQRVVVDTGVSTYERSERHYERSTAAHNTLRIDGEEQAETWASFRVGRRPKVGQVEGGELTGFRFVRGVHYAYQHRGVIHFRMIILTPRNSWVVIDSLRGTGKHLVESFIHFHPAVRVENLSNPASRVAGTAEKLWAIEFTEKRYVLTALGPGRLMARESWYAPEFGMRQHRTTLHWSWEGDLPVRLIYTLTPIGEMPPIISHCLGQELVEIDRISLRLN